MRNLSTIFMIAIAFFTSCKDTASSYNAETPTYEDNSEEINQLNSELRNVTDTLNLCKSSRAYRLSRKDTLIS